MKLVVLQLKACFLGGYGLVVVEVLEQVLSIFWVDLVLFTDSLSTPLGTGVLPSAPEDLQDLLDSQEAIRGLPDGVNVLVIYTFALREFASLFYPL